MPHTNRKKKSLDGKARVHSKQKFSHSKREYISSEDGWTQVADKRWKSMGSKDESRTALGNPLADITLEEMVKDHDQYRQQWESSDACAKLKIILSGMKDEGRCVVENAICLGLGSMQALPMEWRRSSHTQLAALMTIRETLDLKSQVTMQEPRFTGLDKSLLKSMGCELVDHPEAFERINKGSLVYAVHCAFPLLWKVKERADPALLIVNTLGDRRFEEIRYRSEVPGQPADELGILQQNEEETEKIHMKQYDETCSLKRNCEEIAFPQLRNDFSDTMIYWRRLEHTTKSQELLGMENS